MSGDSGSDKNCPFLSRAYQSPPLTMSGTKYRKHKKLNRQKSTRKRPARALPRCPDRPPWGGRVGARHHHDQEIVIFFGRLCQAMIHLAWRLVTLKVRRPGYHR